jgi:hypothetical protein
MNPQKYYQPEFDFHLASEEKYFYIEQSENIGCYYKLKTIIKKVLKTEFLPTTLKSILLESDDISDGLLISYIKENLGDENFGEEDDACYSLSLDFFIKMKKDLLHDLKIIKSNDFNQKVFINKKIKFTHIGENITNSEDYIKKLEIYLNISKHSIKLLKNKSLDNYIDLIY